LLHAFDVHVLSLPPAFVLSQDQTLKFNVLLPRKERDPVTNYSPILLSEPMRSSSELATAETFALLKAQTSAAAGVSLSKQTMHRAHDPGVETFGRTGNRLGRKTLRRNYARRFRYTPFAVGAALIWGWVWGVKR
jgi:hypothetical protein